MRPSFEQQILQRIEAIRERNQAVMRESVQRVIELAQEPGPSMNTKRQAVAAGVGLGKVRKDGTRGVSKRAFGPIPNPGGVGLLPVESGFLRASLRLTTGAIPAATAQPAEGRRYEYNPAASASAIAAWDFRTPLHAVYTANYARHVHYGARGMPARPWVNLAAQRFPQIVAEVAREAPRR